MLLFMLWETEEPARGGVPAAQCRLKSMERPEYIWLARIFLQMPNQLLLIG